MGLEFILNLAAEDVVAVLLVWTDGESLFPDQTSQFLGTGGLCVAFEASRSALPAGRSFVRVSFRLIE